MKLTILALALQLGVMVGANRSWADGCFVWNQGVDMREPSQKAISFFQGDWTGIGSHPLAPIGLSISTSRTFSLTERMFCDEIGENYGRSWVVTNVLTGTWSPASDGAISLSITNHPRQPCKVVCSNDMAFLVESSGVTTVLRRTQEQGAIRIVGRAVLFPGGPNRGLADGEVAEVSDNGELCAVLNLREGVVSLFNTTGNKSSEFKSNGRFGAVAVSASGMTILHSSYVEFGVPYIQDIAVFDPEGKLLKHIQNVPLGELAFVFVPDGNFAALVVSEKDGPKLYQVQNTGECGVKPLRSGYRPGTVLASRDGRLVACSTFFIGEEDDQRMSEIVVLDRGRAEFSTVVCKGALLTDGQMVVSDDGIDLVVVGPGFMSCFDIQKARRKWRREIAHISTGTLPVGKGVAVSVVGDIVVAAHAVPTGTSYKYLITVFDRSGNPRNLFTGTYDGRLLATNGLLTDEQPNPLSVEKLWTVSEDGLSIQLMIAPKTKLPLPN